MSKLFWRQLGLRRGDLIILSLLGIALTCSLIYSLSLMLKPADTVLVRVEQDGQLLDTIRLDTLKEPFERVYRSGIDEEHFNTVRAEPGRIRVIEANCREQIDVRAGWLSIPGQSAICIPHRFVVRLVPAEGAGFDIDVIVR